MLTYPEHAEHAEAIFKFIRTAPRYARYAWITARSCHGTYYLVIRGGGFDLALSLISLWAQVQFRARPD